MMVSKRVTGSGSCSASAVFVAALMALMLLAVAAPEARSAAAPSAAVSDSAAQNRQMAKQLRRLSGQVKRLNRQVRQLRKRKPVAGPQGAPGPQGPQGIPGTSPLLDPAAGDLTGTWPNVSIAPFAIDENKLGDFSVGPMKLNPIKTYTQRTLISAGSGTNVVVSCPAGQVATSGSYQWLTNVAGTFFPSSDLKLSRFMLETNPLTGEDGNRLRLYGHNDTASDRALEARVHCLS